MDRGSGDDRATAEQADTSRYRHFPMSAKIKQSWQSSTRKFSDANRKLW